MTQKTRYVFRDAETGEFVSEEYALENPKTTYRDKIVEQVDEDDVE
jgi:hypothetical protein